MRGVRRALEDDPNPLLQKVLFGGEKGAQTVPKGAGPGLPVEAAKKLEQSGAKAAEIFQQTGWYRGPDQQWKWILSDKGADLNKDVFQTYTTGGGTEEVSLKLKGNETRKLHEVLNHPVLYETYPNLKNATFTRMPAEIAHTGAVADYNPETNTVRVADFRPKTEVLSSLLHELQHGVQSLEGFGRGGAASEFIPLGVRMGKRPETPDDQKIAFDTYSALAGETEARQVQKQFETKNWSQLPTQMEGFPKGSEQLVRQGEDRAIRPGKAYQYTPVDHDPFNGTNPFAYRDDAINAALPVRRDPTMPDIVLQPEDSYGRQGYPLPHTGVLDEPAPPVEPIPPSPWNRPKVDLERGWHEDPNKPNAPFSDESTGSGYKSDFLSPAERGFIGAQPPRQQYTPIDYDPFATNALER